MMPEQILSKAADLIEKQGLCRGAYAVRDPKTGKHMTGGPLCALGAIHLVVSHGKTCGADGTYDLAAPAINLLAERIGGDCIADWNDSSIQEDVVATLRGAETHDDSRRK